MPQRKYKVKRKIESDEVQGEGSWIIVRSPNFEDLGEFDPTQMEDMETNPEVAKEFGFSIAGKMVEDWNWVGDDDRPLPKPKTLDNPMSVLSMPEMMFIIRELNLDSLVDASKIKN